MKKLSAVLLAISFLVIAPGCSEKTTETIQERNGLYYVANETTPFTGTFETKFSNGQKQSTANFKDGKENGLVTFFFENGQKESEVNYKNGKINGLTTRWLENGQIIKKDEDFFGSLTEYILMCVIAFVALKIVARLI